MSSNRKISCPFCTRKEEKERLIRHIERNHKELIPEGYDAERLLFDKTHPDSGKCIVCGNPAQWNPKTGKYTRLCSNPRCKEALREKFKKNMLKVYGKVSLLDDPEQQQKMLANRSISGKYKYSDGTIFTYTGSYELEAIKFMDEVLHCKSEDILMPGPVIEYKDKNGVTRQWITDIYYVPYNLIIEVKDGGDNPNNRQMTEYRDKQISKEAALIKLGQYNYLRLTNNNFVQLMETLALLKDQEINPSDGSDLNKIIRINESVLSESVNSDAYNMQSSNLGLFINMEEFEEDTDKGQLIFGVNNTDILSTLKQLRNYKEYENLRAIDFSQIYSFAKGEKYQSVHSDLGDDNEGDWLIEQYLDLYYDGDYSIFITSNSDYKKYQESDDVTDIYPILEDMIDICMHHKGFILFISYKLYFHILNIYNKALYMPAIFGGIYYASEYSRMRNIIENKPDQDEMVRLSKYIKESALSEIGVSGVGGVMIGTVDGNMMVQYGMYPNSFTGERDGFGVVTNKKQDKMRIKDDNDKTEIVNREPFLQNKFYNAYKHRKPDVNKEDASTLYEEMTGKKLLSKDQVEYDKDFEEIDIERKDKYGFGDVIATLSNDVNNSSELADDYLPICDKMELNQAKMKLREFPEGTTIMEDSKGYFAIDLESGIRSKSYKHIHEIESAPYKKAKIILDKDSDYVDSRVRDINDTGFYKVLDVDYESEDKLTDDWNEFLSLPTELRRQSDDKSIALYGKTNKQRYEELLSKYLDSDIEYKDLPLSEGLQLSDIDKAKDYGINLANKKEEIAYLKEWSLNSGIYCILPCDTEEELDVQWNNLQSMNITLIRISDMRMMEVFGCTNETMYNFMKAKFGNDNYEDEYSFALVESAFDHSDLDFKELPEDLPFYTPYEINAFKEAKTFTNIEKSPERDKWLVEYTKAFNTGEYDPKAIRQWLSEVRALSYQLSVDKDNDELKQELLEYGWNPYLEFDDENRRSAKRRIQEAFHENNIRKLIQEAEFPIQFKKNGDLVVSNILKKRDYENEYQESHRLLKQYEKTENIDPMKYELAKLFYINNRIESDIYSENKTVPRKKLVDIRSRVLNDFNKYMQVVMKKDKQFNFANYYKKSPFSDESITIKAPTLKYSLEYFKQLLHLL